MTLISLVMTKQKMFSGVRRALIVLLFLGLNGWLLSRNIHSLSEDLTCDVSASSTPVSNWLKPGLYWLIKIAGPDRVLAFCVFENTVPEILKTWTEGLLAGTLLTVSVTCRLPLFIRRKIAELKGDEALRIARRLVEWANSKYSDPRKVKDIQIKIESLTK